tara:strand:- start:110 stop:1633 length:1524 start_codon:yes stop_codon:yes gene_type:complete
MTNLSKEIKKTAPPRVIQVPGTPNSTALGNIDQLLLILPEKIPVSLWRKIPNSNKIQALMRRRVKGNIPAIRTRLNNKRHTAVFIGTTDPTKNPFELLTFARKMVASATTEKAGTLGIWVNGFDDEIQEQLVLYLIAAAMAAAYSTPSFKSKPTQTKIKQMKIIGTRERLNLRRVTAEAEGNNLARCLTSLPANKLDAYAYRELLKDIATAEGWDHKEYGISELVEMGAGAFAAVAQGNENDSAAIVKLRYRPGAKEVSPAISLVGKGIIFDTGGSNLKPFNSMLNMHIDMGGSAVALGSLLALARSQAKIPVDAWLAITENRTGPVAYKSQDVVTAMNGKTIQTIHTDAEGRMALADALVLASRDKPEALIDYATLTGACISAITKRYSGVFTNRPDLHPILKKCGRDSGERVWPFPIGKEFLEELKSETADIMQCSPGEGGDHILAASFLEEFVDKTIPWVHVDLSACTRKGGLAHIPTEITGFGVRFTLHLILDSNFVTGKIDI